MHNSLTLGKRALTTAIAAATILWSVGFSAFVAPMTASAAVAGDLIKGPTLTTVYYYAADGMRYAFPNEKTYFSWYTDFSGVVTISDSELAAIPLAGNIVYRPGAHWIKIQSDPKTYAVTPNGAIRWIETEAVATGLAGSAWNMFIQDVPDVFFVDYTVGPSLVSAANAYNGALVNDNGSTYLIWNGQKRLVTANGFTANRFQTRHILMGAGINLAGIPTGTSVTGQEAALVDTAQTGLAAPSGGLSVSLASDTPASATVPGGAASVAFTKVKLMASSGSADVTQMRFKLGGIGAVANLGDAYLYQGAMRLTDGRSVNSSTREVVFGGLPISLASGQMTDVTVRANVATTANGGDTANFGLENPSSVTSSATVSGSFPVTGNTMTFSDTDAGTVTVSKTGSITNPTIGQENAVIGKFNVETDTEDGYLHEITLNVDDAGDHSNYRLWDGATQLAACTSDGDELVTCDLPNPLFLDEGNQERLELSADIGGEAGDLVKVAVEEIADVVAVGTDFGFNMQVDITDYDETGGLCASAADDCSFSTIQGGELTFAFNGPPTDDIQIDGSDQVLMRFTITTENWVEIQSLDVLLTCLEGGVAGAGDCDADLDDDGGLISDTPDVSIFTDIALRMASGATWMGPEEYLPTVAANDAEATLTFDDNQIMTAGTSLDLLVTVDVDDSAEADVLQVRATIDMSTVVAEDQNGDDLGADDIVPTADLVGNVFTVVDASVDVAPASPPSSATYVKGSSNVSVVGYSFEAGDASSVTITDVTVDATGDTDATFTGGTSEDDIDVGDHVSSCSLFDGESGALIDGPESPNATDQLLFENFDWMIPAGDAMKMIMRCNLSNVDVEDADDDAYAFFIAGAASIEAEDADGDNVDATITAVTVADVSSVPTITVTDAGEITVTLDGSSPAANIILGSSTGVITSVYRFDASDEDFLVDRLTLSNCVNYAVADGDDCTGGVGEADGDDRVAAAVKLSYKNQAGSTVTRTGFLSGNKVNYSSLDFYVPDAEVRNLTVMVDSNTVSASSANSGDEIQLNIIDSGLFTPSAAAAYTAEFRAIGAGSGSTIADFGGGDGTVEGVAARRFVARKTKPTISLAAGSPSGAGIPGLNEVLRLNVSADSRGFVTLDTVTFKLTSSDGNASDWNQCGDGLGGAVFADAALWEFYDAADPSEKLDDAGDWTFADAAGDDCTTDASDLRFAILDFEGDATTPAEDIGAGETKTYVLRVDTTGASTADDDSVRVDVPDQNELDTLAGADATEAISWDDSTEATGQDIDGEFIKNLPVTGGTIVY